MALRVTTTGSDVFLKDLGILIAHPTTSRDLSLEFTALELKTSLQLTAAVQGGQLVADDGSYVIHATDYDPDEVLIQQLGYRDDTLYVSEAELGSYGDTYVKPDIFPLALNSTAQVTQNVYCPAGRWITWQVSSDDKVVLTGCPASGIYTVDSILDQQNFTVNEPIVDGTGGFISIFHPEAGLRIGIDDSGFDHITGTNLHDALASIDFMWEQTSGINILTHRELDQLVHNIAEDSFEEVTYDGVHPTSDIIWTNSGKTTKIREEQYTWNGNKVDTLTMIQYDATGIEVERVVETYTYTGPKVTQISRSLV